MWCSASLSLPLTGEIVQNAADHWYLLSSALICFDLSVFIRDEALVVFRCSKSFRFFCCCRAIIGIGRIVCGRGIRCSRRGLIRVVVRRRAGELRRLLGLCFLRSLEQWLDLVAFGQDGD